MCEGAQLANLADVRGAFRNIAGPRMFQIGEDDYGYVYTRLRDLNNVPGPVWKCCKAAHGFGSAGQRLYIFQTASGMFAAAHGDAAMTTPADVQDAYNGGRMTTIFCSLGEDVLSAGDHWWGVCDNGTFDADDVNAFTTSILEA